MIDNASIESLKNQLDIVDVVGNYVELKKSGSNFKARCPFHDENTPSFVVSPAKGIYHCFGCHASGDSISFVMEYEKLSYPEAIEKLAREYNFTLNYTQKGSLEAPQKRVLEVLQKWFFKNIANSHLQYLKQRGISSSSIEKFGIGYAPTNGEFMSFLRQNHILLPDADAVGVVAKNEQGSYYARFTQRITFPIYSANGALVGFGGRTVVDHPAKYINSPQTKLFNKSRTLYGYHIAKQSIYKKKEVIVTEGYIDVIMLVQAGFDTAVATLGTALTQEHLPLLKKGDPEVVLAYDGDAAGVDAALKGAKMLLHSNFDGGVVLFPQGKDPADIIAANKAAEVSQMLRQKKPFFEFIVDTTLTQYDLNSAKQKQNAFEQLQLLLRGLNEIKQDSYIPYAANALGVRPTLFKTKQTQKAKEKIVKDRVDITEKSIIKTVLNNKNYLDMVLDVCSAQMFQIHSHEMQQLELQSYNDPYLIKIDIDDSIITLEYEELKSSLLLILIKYYSNLLQKLPSTQMDFGKKSRRVRKIKTEILPQLRRGNLVAFDILQNI